MAQLPPKIPTSMPPNWLSSPSSGLEPISGSQNPSWVDEFLDFSAEKRLTHRRSVSDSAAFMEALPPKSDNEFDKFDEEQFLNMFSNVGSNPSSPSDNYSFEGEKESTVHGEKKENEEEGKQKKEKLRVKMENEEESGQSQNADAQAPPTPSIIARTSNNRPLDPKRVKRILANRQSAQRSRVRKLQYISELERSVTTLQAEVSLLSPRVAFLDHQRVLLNVDNSALKQRIAALAQDKVFKDAAQEALTREIERLREILSQQQSLQNMENPARNPLQPQPSDFKVPNETEQLLNV